MKTHSVKIPRWIQISPKCSSYQLHGFADASSKVYGSSIYLRCINESGEIISNLIFSKSKISPVKDQTTPRMELCSIIARENRRLCSQVNTSSIVRFIQYFPMVRFTGGFVLAQQIYQEDYFLSSSKIINIGFR